MQKRMTQAQLNEQDTILSDEQLAEQEALWEACLQGHNLKDLEKRYEYSDGASKVYIERQRFQGKPCLSLDVFDEQGIQIASHDEYFQDKDLSIIKRNYDILLAFMMVKALPKVVRKLGYKKIDEDMDWTRKDGQTLRRYMSFLSWIKLENKAREAILEEHRFD